MQFLNVISLYLPQYILHIKCTILILISRISEQVKVNFSNECLQDKDIHSLTTIKYFFLMFSYPAEVSNHFSITPASSFYITFPNNMQILNQHVFEAYYCLRFPITCSISVFTSMFTQRNVVTFCQIFHRHVFHSYLQKVVAKVLETSLSRL